MTSSGMGPLPAYVDGGLGALGALGAWATVDIRTEGLGRFEAFAIN